MDTVGPDSDVVSSKNEGILKYFKSLEIVMYSHYSVGIFYFFQILISKTYQYTPFSR